MEGEEPGRAWQCEEGLNGLQAFRDRLESINQELQALGCTEEFCMEYMLQGGGVCERMAGKRCMKHRGCRGPLPKGKMCAIEFGLRAVELRKQVARLFSLVAPALFQKANLVFAGIACGSGAGQAAARMGSIERAGALFGPFCTGSAGSSCAICLFFLCMPVTPCRAQELVDQRVEDVRNELLHKQKERLDLMAERLQLLAHDPIDTASFHQSLTALLSEKISVLEAIKLRLWPP